MGGNSHPCLPLLYLSSWSVLFVQPLQHQLRCSGGDTRNCNYYYLFFLILLMRLISSSSFFWNCCFHAIVTILPKCDVT